MTEKLYYWAENLDDYSSDNDVEYDEIIEIKRLNFFIGKNNAGKSRFLRKLFQTTMDFAKFQKYDLTIEINNLCKYLNATKFRRPTRHGQDNSWSSNGTSPVNANEIFQITSEIQFINSCKFNFDSVKDLVAQTKSKISNYKEESSNSKEKLEDLFSKIDNKIARIELQENFKHGKLYIPILRGMRPVTNLENKQPYIERAQKDYFSDTTQFNSENIITGECLYHELKIHLLGEPEQRDLIKSYEEKLSQYFFDNELVSLIPKHDQDVVNIKIGKDKQFPISQLGDGLQQAIILTYEAYIKSKDNEGYPEPHAFFIEEPELHMHAGMVRQLMNFYLNETPHYYFFTTHSNHLLDMADESDQVMIQKFVKQPKVDNPSKFDFKIHRCDRDRDLLASLGVRPSSIYLANCTIWVEGITDRLYITKYMQKYLDVLKQEETLVVEGKPNNLDLYKFRSSDIQRLMPNYHYTFVEYAGSNLTHWDFSDEFTDHLDDCGMNALLTSSSVFLIADGDIKTKNKGMRATSLEEKLGEKFFLLECKETENTLPSNIIYHACRIKFLGLNGAFQDDETKRNALSNHLSMDGMQADTKEGFDIVTLIEEHDYFHAKNGIGKILDDQIRVGNPRTTDDKPKKCFSDQSGTIKEKLKFCRLVLTVMDHVEWELTESAKELCEKIFEHIISENPLPNKKTA
ncbi:MULTISPECIES: AAA family ATPase [unclassified Acinetobacter]|nr:MULTISPECIES: AAA family ATPase [unclassified Acinetobacter]